MASKTKANVINENRKQADNDSKQPCNKQFSSMTKGLGLLEFRNPGPKFLEEFNPSNSSREMRKIKRKIYMEKRKKYQVYNQYGGLLADEQRDVCDCLDAGCPGCHFSCPKCSSPKCGLECRNSRCWYYEDIRVEGQSVVINFPHPQPNCSI